MSSQVSGSRFQVPDARIITRAASASALLLLVAELGAAQSGLITREEALAAVYPEAEVGVERVFLTSEQTRHAADLAGVEVISALVARYVATRAGAVVGRAYIDTHVVRTKRESLLISLGADGRVRRIDVTAFLEPREYLAPETWLSQYEARALDDSLALQRGIRPIAGATLTTRATNDAVRRVLAIDLVLEDGRKVAR